MQKKTINDIVQLTEKQKQFYESLKRLMEKNGESPTIAELVGLMKFSSPRAVTQYLESLERKGLIERTRYERRGIRLREHNEGENNMVNIPVLASAGCDNMAILAQRNLGDYVCIAIDLLKGRNKDNVVCVKAVGDSMVDAGIKAGDYVLVEVAEDGKTGIHENDLVVAIIDDFAIIKKIEFSDNAIILHPVSSDPEYKPIILKRNFQLFGKVIDVIRMKPRPSTEAELEIVPLYQNPEEERMQWRFR
jgi:repressor LexA